MHMRRPKRDSLGYKSRYWQSCVPSGEARGELASLPSLDSRSCLPLGFQQQPCIFNLTLALAPAPVATSPSLTLQLPSIFHL